jgi:UPF0755 protein
LAKKTTKKLGKTAAYPSNGKKPLSFGIIGRLAVLLGFLALTALLLGGGVLYWAARPLDVRVIPMEFQVPPGASLSSTITILQNEGISVPEIPFKLLARYRDVAAKIKPGTYLLSSRPTPQELLGKMARGEVVEIEVTIPEGWTFNQLRTRLAAQAGLKQELAGLGAAEILRRIGSTETHPEGLFFPDTYRVDKGSSDLSLLRTAYKAMQGHLEEAWQVRAADSPLKSPYQALILASIIEKETGREDERAMVGSVFVNRLRKGMLLQTDPTVIYGMGEKFDGNIRKRDLLTDTPYNTYTRPGLPPTPIAMPGRASLNAAVRPAQSDALYFVARGDGSSEFSVTLDAHNRAVNRFQRGRP